MGTAEGILVFASKQVGAQLLAHLLELRDPVRRVIAGADADWEIHELAASNGVAVQVYDGDTQAQLAGEGSRYQWLLNLWSPYILGAPALALAQHRLNVHPSLVPNCRGNDNAAWTIRQGVPAGVSLIEMREGVDEGEVYVQRQVAYPFPIRGRQLHALLQRELVALFKEHWPAIREGRTAPQRQAGAGSKFRRRDTEADRVRDASSAMTLEEVIRWGLAHDFAPGTTAEVCFNGRRYKLTLELEPCDANQQER